MAETYCDPYEPCEDLDGRLLINRTMEGPPLARDEGELPLGALSMQGGSIHPYFHVFYDQRWVAKEPCYGPVRSVMGLAPGETITTEVRQREQSDYIRTVQTAFESSEVSTTTRRHGRELIDTDYEGSSVELWPISWIKGSFWEDAWDVVTAPIEAGVDVVNGVIDAVQDGIDSIFDGDDGGAPPGTQASGNSKTLDVIDETISTIQRSESQSSRTDVTTSRSFAVERSITRTFSNPYPDRSLELRFIPVFRHFEVITYLFKVNVGVLLHAGRVNFPARGMGSAFGDFLQRRVTDPRIVSVANAELGLDDDIRAAARSSAVSEHLNANSSLYTGRFLHHLNDQRAFGDIAQPMIRLLGEKRPERPRERGEAAGLRAALEWSKLQVRDKTVYVPLTDPENLVSALGGSEKAVDLGKRLGSTILDPSWLGKFVRRRDVHLFMGTKIEAVAGDCVLEDIPGLVPPGHAGPGGPDGPGHGPGGPGDGPGGPDGPGHGPGGPG